MELWAPASDVGNIAVVNPRHGTHSDSTFFSFAVHYFIHSTYLSRLESASKGYLYPEFDKQSMNPKKYLGTCLNYMDRVLGEVGEVGKSGGKDRIMKQTVIMEWFSTDETHARTRTAEWKELKVGEALK